ncbi:selenide, water dikinase SelD [Celeribacter sp.]|uniref:selenide, water dikinase SelD n=1 Tax=Celeribacter sp. TaxID=1890673 RepID=UPI003A958AF4
MHSLPLTRELVLIGGGHTHALVLKRWGMMPLEGVRVTVINPGPVAAYSGMLPGFVAGHYPRDALELDLIRLARFAGARAVLGRATKIDRDAKLIHVEGHPPIRYDVASIDIGITSAMPDLAGFAEHGIPAKPLEAFASRWTRFRDSVRTEEGARAEAAIIGGGVAGAELAMAMSHALKGVHGARVTLIDRSEILTELRPSTRRAMTAALETAGVHVCPHSDVARVDADRVILTDGREIASQFTLGAAGARPYGWLAETGLNLTRGAIDVTETLQSSDPSIFAAGDCAHLTHAPRPKAGVFAVRQAPVLFDNLRAVLGEDTSPRLRAYNPQKDYLKLISLGGKSALADKVGIRLQGALMWRWKDRIDRAFMSKLKDLEPMAPPPLPKHVAGGLRAEVAGKAPMCGACGAKVGGDVLARVLHAGDGDTTPKRADVEFVAGDDAAVLTHAKGGPKQVISTDHLRAFLPDPALMARIAAVHALGDIWSMGAAPQSALATITLPRLAPHMQEGWLTEIMDAARATFAEAGAQVIGGHTSMGAELSIGFTVTGLTDHPVTLEGAQASDALILTKPIGTGVVLAAEMALQAGGRDVAATYASMAQSSAAAAEILTPHARAMTDVTGFGLAGHLLGICRASGIGAVIDLAAVPVLDGAEALAVRGVASTIAPANRAYAAEYDGPEEGRAALLFDPQTAGGLLACVPEKVAEKLTNQLKNAGYTTAIIGKTTGGPTRLKVTP